jgi:TPP-dependent pyruvate/acetoin dehydrogenase alpha subunit
LACPKATSRRWRPTRHDRDRQAPPRPGPCPGPARSHDPHPPFEDKCAELYTQQKIRGFLHLYDGEEAIAAGVIPVLTEDDRVVATYREHGHALVRGVPMNTVMAEMYGKAEGCSGGRGGSMHLFDAATKFYGGNAIVGGGLPLAGGLALADKMPARTVSRPVSSATARWPRASSTRR